LQHRQPCCKGERKHSCKEIEEGDSQRDETDLMNGEILSGIYRGDQRLFAAKSGSRSSPDPVPLEEHLDPVHGQEVPCGSGPAANQKIEHAALSSNCKNYGISKIPHAKSVCAPICAPLCSTGANAANGVRPLSGVLDARTFGRVRVELGRCDVCGTGKAVYRSREAQAKICEGCYARLVREGNARVGVR
jgi:hypothetical protein